MTDKPDLRVVLQFYGVELRGSRREQSCLCPIHEETRPSCSVNEDKGLIHCQSCGFGGDAYAIIQQKESCDFRAAVRFAEEVLGFSGAGLPQPAGRPGKRVPGGKGFAPRFRHAPSRSRPLSTS